VDLASGCGAIFGEVPAESRRPDCGRHHDIMNGLTIKVID
jgi:hypothetical protein